MTLIFLGLYIRKMIVSLCSPILCRPPNSTGIWKVSQSCHRHRHTHESHIVNVGLHWLLMIPHSECSMDNSKVIHGEYPPHIGLGTQLTTGDQDGYQ